MSFPNWRIQPEQLFSVSPVIPVLVIHDLEQAIPLAGALFAGGIHVLEVTLRTAVAMDAISLLAREFPEALIGAGTVTNKQLLQQASNAGAKFAISPGQTDALLHAGREANIPLIPGVSTVSELMTALDLGYSHFKLFPAAAIGGVQLLRSIYGPFPHARFCPTGGINEQNFGDYLALPNVPCVGGSWIVPEDAIKKGNWSLVTDLCFGVMPVS